MSTDSYKPSETDDQLPEIPLKHCPASTAICMIGSLSATSPSGSTLSIGGYACSFSEVSDDDLITFAQTGDQQAFAELCRRHSPVAKKKILGILRNHEDAEDALQDTLLRAYMHLATFRRSCQFATWITTIGINSALMTLRKRKVRREPRGAASTSDAETPELQEHVDRSPGPEALYLKQQTIFLVRREARKIRPRLRSIVDHYFQSEGSVEELAKAMGISVCAAKSRLQRARACLRSSLVRYGVSNSGT